MNCERHDLPLPCEECEIDDAHVTHTRRGRPVTLFDEQLATPGFEYDPDALLQDEQDELDAELAGVTDA